MAVYNVIDVSDWQGKIDWKKVKADGIVGAIIRYADGTTLDKRFDENMKNAKAAGLHIGCYIFSRATTTTTAESEATRLYNAAKKYSPDMPLYIDLEVSANSKYADTVAAAYLKKMKTLGGIGGVYANLNWWNNYLTKTAKNYKESPFWIAQYYSKMEYKPASLMGMWQYTSSGKVNGISGKVDRDKCYVAYWDKFKSKESSEPVEKQTNDEVLSTSIKKSNAQVIADTIIWAKWIAGDNSFHYGHGKDAHHNGCYFCGTQPSSKKKSGIVDYQKTYCCNPFVGAAWAHGGCVPAALALCKKGSSWGFSKTNGYSKSSLFTNLGKPDKSKLKAGDVLCSDTHVALFIGSGKIAEASGGDDNVKNSQKWNNSIHIVSLTDSKYKKFLRVHRFNGSVNTTANIMHGEVSDRVAILQKKLGITADRIFGDVTLKAVKDFQKSHNLAVDGIVGPKTIAAFQPSKKTIDEIATEVLAGKWGNGDERKAKLIAAGYDYDAVQKKVNELVASDRVALGNAWAKKIAADNRYHYNKWNQSNTQSHKCPICSGLKYENDKTHFGWNCIGFGAAVWRHGMGLKNTCNCYWITGPKGNGEKLLSIQSDAEALKFAQEHIGLKDIQLIRNKNGIPQSQWKAGDICLRFVGDTFNHVFYYMGGGQVADSRGSTGTIPNDQQISIRSSKSETAKVIIRYIGK